MNACSPMTSPAPREPRYTRVSARRACPNVDGSLQDNVEKPRRFILTNDIVAVKVVSLHVRVDAVKRLDRDTGKQWQLSEPPRELVVDVAGHHYLLTRRKSGAVYRSMHRPWKINLTA